MRVQLVSSTRAEPARLRVGAQASPVRGVVGTSINQDASAANIEGAGDGLAHLRLAVAKVRIRATDVQRYD